MTEESCETGWLELKAEEFKPDQTHYKLRVEPSQIRWAAKHHRVCPVHFLVAIGEVWFLVSGKFAEELAQKISYERLHQIALHYFPRKEARENLRRALTNLTLRRSR